MKIRLDGLKMIYKEYALNNIREKIIGWTLQGKKRKIGERKTNRVLKKLIDHSKKSKNWEDVKTMINLPSLFNSDFEKIMLDFNNYVKSKLNKKADYTFDGVYFESIEKIGAFQQIVNLKNAIKQDN